MRKRNIILVFAGIMVVVLAAIGIYFWHRNAFYVITEDAHIDGTIYKASPQIAGKLVEVNVEEGNMVKAGDIVARADDTTLPPNANLDLTLIKSPIDGVIINKIVSPGEVVAVGQPVALVVDQENLYVTANVEETNLSRIKTGQKVDFTVDSLPGRRFNGYVVSIQKATVSTFSLLPQSNSSGNFTKVTQRVEVKIAFDHNKDNNKKENLLFGANVVAKIHVR